MGKFLCRILQNIKLNVSVDSWACEVTEIFTQRSSEEASIV